MLTNTDTFLCAISWIFLLWTVAAWPEITSKGKHKRVQEAQKISENDANVPGFPEPINNVTVSVGRDALMACVVDNLKGYKIAWVRVDTQTILSIHHNVISQNNRISLSYNDHRSWYLHIREVEESDRGWYMCQVNTDPMRSQKGYLQVVVPPVIIESLTSNDMVVREGLNVTLMCKARGYPEPYVMWRREDGEEMLIGGEHVNVVDGELLHITKVSRLHMAAYLCVASNGVPPSISKRVHLRVQFPPMLSIPNQLEGAYVGQDVILECHTEAYPASINYWTTERGDMIISDTSRAGDKYETTSTVSGYTKYMKLKIRSVGLNDFGTYRCVAKNSLGETDGNIKLDEMPTPTIAVVTDMAGWNRSLVGKHRHRNKFDLNVLPDYGIEEWRDGVGNGVAGNSASDGNQTPVRNPPGAFHNSANSLAQHNLLGGIILWIKMQSFGICKHLSSWCQRQWQWQPQHRKERQQNEAEQSQRNEVSQKLKAKLRKQRIHKAQQQQHSNWLSLMYQPKSHFSSLHWVTAAYEQSAATNVFMVAYTQRFFWMLPQWLIRRIATLKTLAEHAEARMKREHAKNNELQNKGQADAAPTPRYMALIWRLRLLTTPFLRTISAGILPKTTTTITSRAKNTFKSTQMSTKVGCVAKVAVNGDTYVTVALKTVASVAAADDRVAVEDLVVARREILEARDNIYSSSTAKVSNSGNMCAAQDDSSRQTRSNNQEIESDINKMSLKTSRIMCNNSESNKCAPNRVDNNFSYNLQKPHKFQSHTEAFVLFPFLLTFTETEMFSAICLLLVFAYICLCKAHAQENEQKQQRSAQVLRNITPPISLLQLISSHRNKRPASGSGSGTSMHTITARTTTFPISCQRREIGIKIISTTSIITFLCNRQWVAGKSVVAASQQPQTVTISSSKGATANRSTTAEAAKVYSTISTPAKTRAATTRAAAATTTVPTAAATVAAARAALMAASIVTSFAAYCGLALR